MTQVTLLLQDLETADGDRRKQILDHVVTLLSDQLREQAEYRMALEPAGHILQATALLNEFYLRVIESRMSFSDRQHFILAAARIMRNIVVDEARRTRAQKRGGDHHVTALDFDSAGAAVSSQPETIIDLNEALRQLAPEDEQLVDLRYFYGLTLEQTAETMNIPYDTLKKRWVRVRRQLFKSLSTSSNADES